MINEIIDKESGAILFKKDPDSRKYEDILRELDQQKKEISELSRKVDILMKMLNIYM